MGRPGIKARGGKFAVMSGTEHNVRRCNARVHQQRAPGSLPAPHTPPMAGSRGHTDFRATRTPPLSRLACEVSRMKTRVIIEYHLPRSFAAGGDRVVVRDQEEQRWTTCETVLALPGSAKVKVELLEAPLMPAV